MRVLSSPRTPPSNRIHRRIAPLAEGSENNLPSHALAEANWG